MKRKLWLLNFALIALVAAGIWRLRKEAQEFHALLAEQGRRFVDAPVSGGVGGAAAGTLAVMAGGSAQDFAELGFTEEAIWTRP